MLKITAGLYLLACQALPGLYRKYHSESEFTSDIYDPNHSAKQLKELEKKRMAAASKLFEEKRISWWDVFDASEIGAERRIIASRYVVRDSEVLDVGCGRGFFSFACARRAKHVTALDFMDGKGRIGWWEDFLQSTAQLSLTGRISGVRASAICLPFGRRSFDAVTSVHGVRNLEDLEELKLFVSEAARVLKKGGRFILAESDLDRNGAGAYKAFYAMRARIGWEMRLPSSAEIVDILSNSGFSKVRQTILKTHLKYAPIYFPLNQAKMGGIERQYRDAKRLLIEEGEEHPPVLVTVALR